MMTPAGLIRRMRSERGQMLVVVAISATMLLGFLGLIVDTGYFYAQRRQTQNGADEAAMAAAREVLYGGSTSDATTAALSNASANGFDNNGSTNTVTVHIPPTSGPHVGDSEYVEAIVWQKPKTVFIHALGVGGSVQSRGVAGFIHVPKPYALLVLDPTMCSSYSQTNTNTMTINGGGAMVNSSCDPSGDLSGGSAFNSDFIDYYYEGSWELSNNASTSVPPTSLASRIDDPLASLAEPIPCNAGGQPAGCIPRSPDSRGTANNPRQTLITAADGAATLHPGTYYGGIKIAGTGGVTMTFLPGLYLMAGGGFEYDASAGISGNGVAIFNTYDSAKPNQGPTSPGGAGACHSITLNGSGTLSLTAPTSGPYEDMLFWQDAECTNDFTYAGSADYETNGIIYLPTAQLDLAGGGSLGALQIIVNSFEFSGAQNVTIDYGDYVPITQPKVVLVE